MIGADGARRRPGGHRRQGPAARADAVRDPDHRLADRAGGEDRRGPAEDRPRHLQPPRQGHAAGDRRQRALRHAGRPAATRRPSRSTSSARRPGRTTRTSTRACRRRRSPTRAGRRSGPPSTRRPNPSVGDPLCAELPEGAPCQYLYYVLADEEGNHAFAVTRRAARGQRRRRGRRRRARLTVAVPVAAVIGHPGRALAVAGAAQRGVRGRPGSTGRTSRSTSRPVRPRAALEAMRTLGIGGLSVTMPHKEDVAAAVDELAPAAAALRSVNTVARGDGRAARRPQHRRRRLRRLARGGGRRRRRRSRSPSSAPAAAARSVVDALGRAGAADIAVVNRTRGAGRRRGGARRRWPASARPTTSAAADIVVNATSVGMGTDELPFDPALLRPGQVVADLVYHPLETALLRAAAAAGCHDRRRPRDARPPGRPAAGAVDRRPPRPGGHARRRRGRARPPRRRLTPSECFVHPSACVRVAARRSTPMQRTLGWIGLGPGARPVAWRAVLRYLTAGESHGQALVVIVEGLPAGLAVTVEDIQAELARRRLGYGRGPRQRFEVDELTLVGGVRHGRTLGSPVAIEIKNTEWFRSDKWHAEMDAGARARPKSPLTQVRPGHADLAGHAEVRLHRRPRRARAGQRPGDGGPRRRRRPGQAAAAPSSASTCSPTSCRWARPCRPAPARRSPTWPRSTSRRCAASTPAAPRR